MLHSRAPQVELRSILGATLAQERDWVVEASQAVDGDARPKGFASSTKRHPTEEEWAALRFAWRICAHVKSNTVIFTDAARTLAIGAGQMSRVDAVRTAVMKAADRPKRRRVRSRDRWPPRMPTFRFAMASTRSRRPERPPSFSRADPCAMLK